MQTTFGQSKGWRVLYFFLLVLAFSLPASAQQGSPGRMKVTFTGYTKTGTLTNFPALVRLSEGLTNFLYSQFASPAGHDLRFYDASGATELAYEIDTWNPAGTSLVWVNVPLLAGSNDYVWACWGDAGQTNPPAYTTNGAVWAADYRLVLHMGSAADSSANRIPGADSNVTWSSAQIGNGGWFGGSNSLVQKSQVAALKPASCITLSAWVWPRNLGTAVYREIYRKDDGTGRQLLSFQGSGTILSFGLGVVGSYAELDVAISAAAYTDTWHLVTAVYDGQKKRLYKDGVEIGWSNTVGAISSSNLVPAYVGCTAGASEWFDGGIDEMRVSGMARSSNWVWACWQNQKAATDFLTYEPLPVLGTIPATLAFSATYNGADPADQAFVVTNQADLAGSYTNVISYGPGGSGWLSITPPSASLAGFGQATHTGSVTIAGLNAGTYTATNALHSIPSQTPLGCVVVTLSVARASQAITFPAIPNQSATNLYLLGATASSGLAVSFAVGAGPAMITGGTNLTFTGTGTVSIVASQAGDMNWNAAPSVTNTLTVSASPALPRRMKVTFSGYTKQESLTNFPALIRLSEGLPDFLYSQFASPLGYDLRFYDAAGTTELAYEVEKWDTEGVSFVWVNIPCLGGSNDYIWACWGDTSRLSQPACTTNGSAWSADYRLVMHMLSALDSSTNRLSGTAGTDVVFTNGCISASCVLNGTSSRIRKDHNPVLKPASEITISAWIKPENVVAMSPEIYRKEDDLDRHLLGFQTTGTMLTLGLKIAGTYRELDVPISAANYTDAWHLVTAVYDGSAMRMYRDGVQIGMTNITGAISTVGTNHAYVGCNSASSEWFKGGIDELCVSGTGRSSNWVWACWQNQKAGSTFVTCESLPVIGIAPASLLFNATYGGANPAAQDFVVTNLATLSGSYTNVISYGAGGSGWLAVTASAGALPGEASATHSGSVSIAGLNAGAYTATNALLSIPSMTSLGHVVVTLAVARASQTITFSAIPDQVTSNLYPLSASASSGLAVSFAVGSGPVSIAGGTNLSFTGTGTVSVVASQAGNANWNAALPKTNSFHVTKATQSTLVFTPGTPQTFGTTNTLSTTGGSGTGVVSYAVLSGAGQIVGSNRLEMLAGTGSVTVVATKAADDLYVVRSATGVVVAAKAAQTITFPGIPGQLVTNFYRLSATASSALGVSFVVGSGPGALSGGTNLSFTGAGTVSVVASQAGNANWAAAAPVTNTVAVSRISQSGLVFAPTSPQAYGTTNLLSTTGGSGTGAVSYAVLSGPGQVVDTCWLAVSSGTGSVSVVATKAADVIYNARSVTGTVAAAKAAQTITFATIADQWVTNTVRLFATTSSGLGVSFAVASGPASITGGTNLTFSGAGTVKIVASQAGNANLQAAPSVTNAFKSQTFKIASISAVQLGDASGRVQISYTLGCHPTSQVANVAVSFSTNAGLLWTALNAGVLTGDFGSGIGSGSRLVTWNASAEPIRNYNTLIRLIATTGSETVTNVSDRFNLDVLSLNSGLRVRGRVCSATTRLPLVSADIRMANTNVVGAVLSDGYFVLNNLGIIYGNTLTVSNAGFAASVQQVDVPAGSVEIAVPTIYLQPLPPKAPVITALTPRMQGIFVHGVRMDNDFTASVNWNGLVPDAVVLYANNRVIRQWTSPSAAQFTCTTNMGDAFSPSLTLRDNRVTAWVSGHDGSTLEVATNALSIYPCVIAAPPALSVLTSVINFNVPGEFSLGLSLPPEPWEKTVTLPVIGKFGFEIGVPLAFAYSIPRGGAWEFKVGRNSSGSSTGKEGKTKLFVGQKEIEVNIQGVASGVADMERGFAVDKLGVHADLNVKLLLGWVGLLDLVPGASGAASVVPGGESILRNVAVGIYVIPGLAGDLTCSLNPSLNFDSVLITGKVGLEGAYEPKWDPVEVRIYVGGEPSVQVGFPGDFFKYVRFRAYAGAEFKCWIVKLGYENVFVDVRYPAGLSAYGLDGDEAQDFVVLQGANNNKLRPLDRKYLLQGPERFLAGGARATGAALAAALAAPVTTSMDAFRAIGQGPVSGSVQALAAPGQRGGGALPRAQAEVTVIGNGFPDSSPALASISTNLMLLYVADNGASNDLQFADIHWTWYDGWNWSAPAPIVTDTRSEFNPQVKFDGNGDAIAVWERISDTNFTTLDLIAMAAEMEIVWARWNHLTGTWTEPIAMTTNTWLDHAPLLAGPLDNGDLMVTWVENTANLLTGTGTVGSAQNDAVLWARWDAAGRSWSPAQVLVSNMAERSAQSSSAAGTQAVYAWSADGDANPDDNTGAEVYAKHWSNDTWSATIRCTSNSVPDKNVRVAVSAAGTVHMVWQQESSLVSSLNFSSSPKLVRSESGSVGFSGFAMTYGPLGNMVLLWQEMTPNGSDAHYAVYDPASDIWSKDATLFNDATLERSFAPVWDNVGNLTVAYNAVDMTKTNVEVALEGGGSITVSNVPQSGAVSLAVVKKALVTDVAILPRDFTVVGANYLPGDAVTLSTVLRNTGDIPVSNAAVAFYYGNPANGGVLITNAVWAGWLEGAATNAICSTVWMVPEPGTNLTFYAVANPAHAITEFTENNNTQMVVAGGTDLSVTLGSASPEPDGSMLVIARVENIGSPAATNTILAIRRKGESGAPLATAAVPALAPGMNVQMAIDLGPGIQPEGLAGYVLNADDGKVVADLATNNNQLAFSVNLWLDSDNDGMPDGWETTKGLDPLIALDAGGDKDGDGMSNYAEWRAGTDPTNANSYLSVVSLALPALETPGSGFRIAWGSESNRIYTVSRATNLVEGIGFTPLVEHILATPPVNAHTDTTVGTNAGPFFYRIDLE